VDLGDLAPDVSVGDSVLVDGVCLTATTRQGNRAQFDVSAETLRLTTLGGLKRGSRVNLELAMRPSDRFGGHLVSGHVDGTGTIVAKSPLPGETRLTVSVASRLTDMMVPKGSVAVDGISLTVAQLKDGSFEVSLIPYTLSATTLGMKAAGDRVNVECDMLGKWIRRLLRRGDEGRDAGGGLTLDRLREEGF